MRDKLQSYLHEGRLVFVCYKCKGTGWFQVSKPCLMCNGFKYLDQRSANSWYMKHRSRPDSVISQGQKDAVLAMLKAFDTIGKLRLKPIANTIDNKPRFKMRVAA